MASKDHGLLQPKPSPAPARPLVPRALRGLSIVYNLPANEASAKFGTWSMMALRDVSVSGVNVQKGEFFRLNGADAIYLAMNRAAEFIDTESKEEEAALATLKKLDRPIDRRQLAEFK